MMEGDALQGFGGQADGAHQRRVAFGVLRQINRPAHANRDSDKQRNQRNQQRVDDGGQHRLVFRRVLQAEQLRRQVRNALDKQVNDDGKQGENRNQHRQAAQQPQKRAGWMTPPAVAFIAEEIPDGMRAIRGGVHHCCSLLFSTEKEALISRIKTNSTMPAAISASRCSPSA